MPKTSLIEEKLREKAKWASKELQGLRQSKVEDIFTKRYYISPEDLLVTNFPRSRPLAAFNPGAFERDGKLFIFPRLIFDYYSYVSSIGVATVNIEKVINGEIEKPLKVKIILWPEKIWEFGHGCEDPRFFLFDNTIYMLYTGSRCHHEDDHLVSKSVLGFAELNPIFEIKRRGYFSITRGNDSFIPSNKDSAFIEVKKDRATMLTRVSLGDTALCWRAEANLKDLTMCEETLKPVLVPEKWEYKVGWSTNTVKLSTNEYLVGWHGVLKEDLSYRNGLAIVDDSGVLLAVSDYLLAPRGLAESYGDRPLVIFGDGLVRYGDCLIWIGGVSDYCIGIFITELSKALEKLKWIR